MPTFCSMAVRPTHRNHRYGLGLAAAIASLGVGTPAFSADLTTQEKRSFAAVALTVGYCMMEQKVVSQQESVAVAIQLADYKGLSRDELIAFSEEPGFKDQMTQVETASGGCKMIVDKFKGALKPSR